MPQILAFGQHGREAVEIGSDGVDSIGLAGQFEQGRGVATGHARNQ
jgi:hypothetical protein